MIKFHCAHCGKKIGTPERYLGRQVRCPQCNNAVAVPDPEPISAPEPVEEPIAAMDNENIWSDDMFAAQDQPNSYNLAQDSEETPGKECPTCGTQCEPNAVLCVSCGYNFKTGGSIHIPAEPTRAGGPSRKLYGGGISAWDNLKVRFGFMMALCAGFGAAIVSGMLWGLVGKWTGFEIGYVAIVVGLIVGAAMYVFTNDHSTALGVFAGFFAVLGILCGKYYIAKWVVMPMFEEQLQNKDSELNQAMNDGFDESFSKGSALTEQEIRDLLRDPDHMFMVGCWYFDQQGTWTQYDNDTDGKFADLLPSYRDGWLEPEPEQVEMANAEIARVEDQLGQWPPMEKRRQVIAHHEFQIAEIREAAEQFAEGAKDAFVGSKAGMFIAFISTFGFLDILWFILAIGSAFKVASGVYET